MFGRQPYNGSFRKLVLAFDVGTTFSGISYCILDPGEVPVVRGVTRFPAQEHVGGDSKIPTIIFYDRSGVVQAVGAEAVSEATREAAEENGWIKAEWFKLHLRPKTTSAAFVSEKIPPLPREKTAVNVLSDFLRYLHGCAREFIEESHANGSDLWRSLETRTEFVLSHPNGWEGGQQGLMRKAAIMAGLVPDTVDGQSRLCFVTEGEASLHFCIQSGLITEAIEAGKGVLVLDAGGGTIDITTYKKDPDSVFYEEIALPQCSFHGSIFVTRKAQEFLEDLLKDSKFVADIPNITDQFDKTTKLRFVNPDENQFIRFGGLRDKAPELNIKSGQLKLLGSVVANFFEPSVTAIIKMVEDQCRTSKTEISSVFLVGGFAASNWLFNNLKDTFGPRGLHVCRPDNHTNKAVADGAVSYHIDHFVRSRVAKYSYGKPSAIAYNPSDPEHLAHRHFVYTNFIGHKMVRRFFSVILRKNTRVSETQEFRESYLIRSRHPGELDSISDPIMCFRGWNPNPRWLDEEPKMYSTLCWVEADLSHLPKPGKYSTHIHDLYYEVKFDVILSLGLTEFNAFIAWREKGVEKRTPAQIVYDPERVIDDSMDGADPL